MLICTFADSSEEIPELSVAIVHNNKCRAIKRGGDRLRAVPGGMDHFFYAALMITSE